MRDRIWALVCAMVFASAIAGAQPDTRRTTEAVTLRKKPGEKEAAVGKLPANTAVIVLAEEGRWVKVKAGNQVGYITRTTLAAAATADAPASTGGWGEKRPSDEDVLGHANTARSTTTVAAGTATDGVTATYTREAASALQIRAELGIAYRSLGMDLTSNAEGGLTNYLVDADAAAAVLGVDATQRFGSLFAAIDARAVASISSPGIDYPGPTAPPGKIPFKTFAIDAGVRAGIHVKDAIDLGVRAGGHYDAFLTESVDNVGMLPRERLLGVTIGARADVVPPHSRFAASLRFDYLVIGSRAQTAGLEDGTASTAHALWGGVTVRYQLGAHVAPFAGYDFGRATTSWTGMSVREPSVSNAHRVDTSQLVQIGVAAEL